MHWISPLSSGVAHAREKKFFHILRFTLSPSLVLPGNKKSASLPCTFFQSRWASWEKCCSREILVFCAYCHKLQPQPSPWCFETWCSCQTGRLPPFTISLLSQNPFCVRGTMILSEPQNENDIWLQLSFTPHVQEIPSPTDTLNQYSSKHSPCHFPCHLQRPPWLCFPPECSPHLLSGSLSPAQGWLLGFRLLFSSVLLSPPLELYTVMNLEDLFLLHRKRLLIN